MSRPGEECTTCVRVELLLFFALTSGEVAVNDVTSSGIGLKLSASSRKPVFAFIPEHRSESSWNRVHLAPDSPWPCHRRGQRLPVWSRRVMQRVRST